MVKNLDDGTKNTIMRIISTTQIQIQKCETNKKSKTLITKVSFLKNKTLV